MNGGDCFNPLDEKFAAQFAKPADLGDVNFRALTPMQRALLVIDGTVTKFLEAYTLEPVKILRLAQDTKTLTADHAWLEAVRGTKVTLREVLIEGKFSHSLYVWAASLVIFDRLPGAIAERLELDGEGLGRVLNDHAVETRREILWYGREHAVELPAALRSRADGEFVSRTYRIVAGGKPIALINERFPANPARLPLHH